MSKNDVNSELDVRKEDYDQLAKETVEENKKEKKVEKTSPVPADEVLKKSERSKRGMAVNSRYIQVRKIPSGSAQVVAIMNAGDKAEILDRIDGFYKIKTDKGNHIGYVASQYFVED